MKAILLVAMLTLGAVSALAAPVDTAVTPEPGTIVLLGAGLAGIGLASWRRSRKK